MFIYIFSFSEGKFVLFKPIAIKTENARFNSEPRILCFDFKFSEVHQRSGTTTLPFPFMASRQVPLMMVGGR